MSINNISGVEPAAQSSSHQNLSLQQNKDVINLDAVKQIADQLPTVSNDIPGLGSLLGKDSDQNVKQAYDRMHHRHSRG